MVTHDTIYNPFNRHHMDSKDLPRPPSVQSPQTCVGMNAISAKRNVNISSAGRDVNIYNGLSGFEQGTRERHKILNWVSRINFKAIHKDTFSRVAPETGVWFLESLEFQDWLETDNGVLWGVGIAGAGKTFLSSIVINELQRRYQEDPEVTVIFVYCRFEENHTEHDILAALLRQMAENSDSVFQYVKEHMYGRSVRDNVAPTWQEISQAVENSMSHFSRVIIVIDALDELRDDIRNDLTYTIQSFSASVLFTCRPVGLWGMGGIGIKISPQSEELRRFVRQGLLRLPKLRGNIMQRKEVLDKVVDTIERKSQGMFLLARLQLNALKNVMTINGLLTAVKSLPDSLAEMYMITIQRIHEQSNEEILMAIRAFVWIAHSRRPLKVGELCIAIAAHPGCRSLEPDDIIPESVLLSICYGLITIEEENNTVRFSHYTTHEFFLSYTEAPFTAPHRCIADSCGLVLGILTSGGEKWPSTTQEFKDLQHKCDLWSYSCAYLGSHLYEAKSVSSQITKLLRHSNLLPLQNNEGDFERCDYGSAAHFAAKHGILPLISRLPQSFEEESRRGITPLMFAAGNDHLRCVQEILKSGAPNVNRLARHQSSSALSRACIHGQLRIVNFLLAFPGVDINTTYAGIPLLHALIQYGTKDPATQHEIMKALLLHPNFSTTTVDLDSRTPVHYVAEYGADATILRLLLENGCLQVINAKDKHGKTALDISMAKNRLLTCQVLEEFGGVNHRGVQRRRARGYFLDSWSETKYRSRRFGSTTPNAKPRTGTALSARVEEYILPHAPLAGPGTHSNHLYYQFKGFFQFTQAAGRLTS